MGRCCESLKIAMGHIDAEAKKTNVDLPRFFQPPISAGILPLIFLVFQALNSRRLDMIVSVGMVPSNSVLEMSKYSKPGIACMTSSKRPPRFALV